MDKAPREGAGSEGANFQIVQVAEGVTLSPCPQDPVPPGEPRARATPDHSHTRDTV